MSDANPVEFVRLAEIDAPTLSQLINNPRVQRHMPLAQGSMSNAEIHDWVRAKESYWDDPGFGPWAFRIGGIFAGWGGLQPWNDEVEIALVLKPEFWGYGRAIFDRCLSYAFDHLHLTHVVALLPYTRKEGRALLHLGFSLVGSAVTDNESFRVYRIDASGLQG